MKSMTKMTRFNKVMSLVLAVLMLAGLLVPFTVSAAIEDGGVENEYSLKIVDANGQAVNGALVSVTAEGVTETDVHTNENGVAVFKAVGSDELKVVINNIRKDGDNELIAASFNVTLKKDETVEFAFEAEAPAEPTVSYSTDWTKEDVVLTATSTSEDVAYYKWSDGTKSNTLTVTENRTYTVVAVDGFKNESAPASVTVTNIDKTAPVVSVTSAPDSRYHQSITVTVTATDENGSGVAFYKKDGNEWVAASQENANIFTVTDNGKHIFSVKDAAGNEQSVEFDVDVIDTEKPTISTIVPADDKWHNDFVEYTVTATDDKTDMELTYGVGESFETVKWENLGDNTIAVDERKAYIFWVKDSAGNISDPFTLAELPKIDKVAPVISDVVATDVNGVVVTAGSENWTNQPVTFTVSATDEGGSNIVGYSIDNVTWQDSPVFADIKTAEVITFYVKDAAGNVSTFDKSANYDAKAPVITAVEVDPWNSEKNQPKATNEPIKFKITANDDPDETNGESKIVAYCKVKTVNGRSEKPTKDYDGWKSGAVLEATDSEIYHIYAMDKAGNISKAYNKDGNYNVRGWYDAKAATINSVVFEQKNKNALAEFANKLSFGAFFNENVKITINALDEADGNIHVSSGIGSYKLYFYENGDTEKEPIVLPKGNEANKSGVFKVNQDFAETFKGTIYVEVIDAVGNTTGEVLVVSSEMSEEGTVKSNIKDLPDNMFMIESNAPDIEFTSENTINKGLFEVLFNVTDGSENENETVSGINLVKVTVNGEIVEKEIDGVKFKEVQGGKSYVDEVYKGAAPDLSNNYTISVNSFEKIVAVNGTAIDGIVWPANVGDKLNVIIEAVDNAGNVAAIESRDIQIDNTAPSIKAFDFGSTPKETIEVSGDGFGFIFNTAVDVTIKAEDNKTEGDTAISGVKEIAYVLIPALEENQTEAKLPTEFEPIIRPAENGEITVTIPAGFKGQIHAYAIDNVGNYPVKGDTSDPEYIHPYGVITETEEEHKNEKYGNELVDHVALTVSGDFVGYKENCNLYKDDVFVDVVITDRQSTIAKVDWQIILPGKEELNETGTVIVENDFNGVKATSYSDGKYDWKVVDRDPSLNPFGEHLTTQLSNTIKVSKDYNCDEIVVKVIMTDRAGNTTSDSVKLSIDSEAPVKGVISVTSTDGRDVSSTTSNWTNEEVTFTVTSEDLAKVGYPFASDIVGYVADPDTTISPDEWSWQETNEFEFSDQETHYFYVIDKAGNVSEVATAKANYDNIAPVITGVTPKLFDGTELDEDTWTNDTVYFDVSVEDKATKEQYKDIVDIGVDFKNSGIAYLCMLDSGATKPDKNYEGWQPEGAYEFPVNDFKTHDFYVMDHAGNISEVDSEDAEMFDAKNPELVNVVFHQQNDSAFAKTVNFLTFGTFFKETLEVTVNTKDAVDETNGASGVKTVDLVFKSVSGDEIVISKEVDYNDSIGEKISDTVFEIKNEEDLENFKGTVYVNIYDYAITGKEAGEGEYAGNMTTVDVTAGEHGNSNIDIECPEIMIENDAPEISDIRAYNEFENEPFVAVTGENIFKHNFNFEFDVNDKFDNDNEFSGIHWVDVTVNGTHIYTTPIEDEDKNGKFYLESKQEEMVTYTLLVDIDDKNHTVDGKLIEEWNNGVLEIKVNACDNAGNTAIEKSRIVYLDETSAVIDGFTFKPTDNTALNTETIDVKPDENGLYKAVTTDDYGFYFQKDIDVTIYASDKTSDDESKASGVKEIEYKYIGIDENGAPVNVTGKAVFTEADIKDDQVKTTVTIPAGFKGQIYAYATDNVGNKPTDCVNYNGDEIDSEGYAHPEASIIETPEAHKAELNHIVFTVDPTEFTQNDGTPLYAGNVNVRIDVKDEYAGLRSVEWEVKAPQDTGNNYVGSFDIDNSGFIKYSDGTKDTNWEKDGTDKNLVTKLNTTLTVANNSNDIVVSVKITDRAGNISEEEIKFGIDKTIPTIDITYDNNTPDAQYTDIYNKDRTATVVITERNFRAKDVVFKITSTDGTIPSIDLTKEASWKTVAGETPDKTTHVAVFTYNADGDYTFDISYKDNAENAAPAVAQHKFTIDKTLPVISSVVYDNNDVRNGNYYKADRVATITIVEHNFDPARIVNLGVATDDAAPVVFPAISAWTTVGDTHTATIHYSADALYTFDIDFKDMAGNNIEDYVPHAFYVDKTRPTLVIDGVAANSANKSEGNIGFTITAADTNMDVFAPVVKAMVLNLETGMFVEKTINIGTAITGHNTASYVVTNLIDDGVYSITCSVVDKAGNSFDVVVLEDENGATFTERVSDDKPLILFSVNRNGSTFYVDDPYTKELALEGGSYYTQKVESDLLIKEFNPDSIQLNDVTITVNGQKLEEGTDYERTASQNGGYTYLYTIYKTNFESEGEYNIVIGTKDRATNEAYSDMKFGAIKFVVDKTAPVVTVTGLKTNGRYQVEEQTVTLAPTDDGGLITKLRVILTDKEGNEIEELLILEGEELADALAKGSVSFNIPAKNSAQYVKVICEDKAGNKIGADGLGEVFSNVTITTNAFLIFWANPVARYSAIAAVVVLAAAIIFFIILKNKKKNGEADK